MKRSNRGQKSLVTLTAFTGVIVLIIAIHYWDKPILEFHGFRQTQTALTSYWMMREGWRLDYQTPVAGYPWSIPFEFPIYQSIVALLASLGGFPLDPTGRFVSLFFLFVSALPAFGIARRLKLPEEVPWVFSALLWSSPIYLGLGRTFLIETTAVFFTFASVPYAIDLMEERARWQSAFGFMFWMTLGMLQKITTSFPLLVTLSLLIAIVHFRTLGLRLPNRRKIAQILVAFAVPIILGGLWSHYTSIIRSENVLGMEMTSQKINSWLFGTLQQRLDVNVFRTIFIDRVFYRHIADFLVLGTAFIVGHPRRKTLLLICLILFLLPIEMFINLHFIHDYYQASSVLFIIGGFSIAVVDVIQKYSRNKASILPLATLGMVFIHLISFGRIYLPYIEYFNTSENQTLLVSSVLKEYTLTDSAIVIYGPNYSSEIAYYSERKSLTVPRWEKSNWSDKYWPEKYWGIWQDPEPYLGGKELGALAFCEGGDNQFTLDKILENQFVRLRPRLFKVSNCYIWLPDVDEISIPGSDKIVLPMDL